MMERGHDEDDDALDDREMPDAADMDRDDGSDSVDTEPCPFCGRLIYEQSEICPHCQNFVSREEAANRKRYPLWIFVGAIVCIAIVLLTFLRRG